MQTQLANKPAGEYGAESRETKAKPAALPISRQQDPVATRPRTEQQRQPRITSHSPRVAARPSAGAARALSREHAGLGAAERDAASAGSIAVLGSALPLTHARRDTVTDAGTRTRPRVCATGQPVVAQNLERQRAACGQAGALAEAPHCRAHERDLIPHGHRRPGLQVRHPGPGLLSLVLRQLNGDFLFFCFFCS